MPKGSEQLQNVPPKVKERNEIVITGINQNCFEIDTFQRNKYYEILYGIFHYLLHIWSYDIFRMLNDTRK